MKLLSLKLLHYRRFRQQEIIFKDDFSLIFGKNGAGKSSVLDAIWYTLFWPSSKDFVRVNRSYLKSYFLTDREPSKVELVFQYGLATYKIVRIIDAGTKKFASEFIPEIKDTLTGPDGLEIIGWDEITDFVSELIGVNKDTFLRSVFAKQKDLEVLSWPTAERKKLINSVLWLDKIENIVLDLAKQEREKKTLLEIYKKKISEFDLEALKTQKEELIEKQKEVEQNLKNQENEQKELSEQFKTIQHDFDLINQKRNLYVQYTSDINLKTQQNKNFTENIQEKTLEIQEIEKKEIYLKENVSLLKQNEELKKLLLEWEVKKTQYIQKQNLQKELEQYKTLSLEWEKNLKGISPESWQKNIQQNDELMEEKTQSLKKLQSQKSSLEAEVLQIKKSGEELKKELETIQSLGKDSSCPTCKRPLLEDFPKLLSLFDTELSKKREEYKTKNELLSEVTLQIQKEETELDKLKDIQKQLTQSEKEFLISKQKYENVLQNITLIDEKLAVLKDIDYSLEHHEKLQQQYTQVSLKFQEYTKIQGQVSKKDELIKSVENLKKSYEENILLWKEIEIQKDALHFKTQDFDVMKKRYDEINEHIHLKNTQVNEIQKMKLSGEFQIKNLEKQEWDFKDDKKTIDTLVSEIDASTLKKQIMGDYILYLLQYMKPRIEDLASEYFSLITDYKYTQISLDDEYNILIDGKNLDLYSGGERDLANLCFRLSLWQNLTSSKWNPINFLILDEILASQDKERQQNILINLKKLENKFSQIILISHLDEIKDLATNLIEIRALNREESIINYY